MAMMESTPFSAAQKNGLRGPCGRRAGIRHENGACARRVTKYSCGARTRTNLVFTSGYNAWRFYFQIACALLPQYPGTDVHGSTRSARRGMPNGSNGTCAESAFVVDWVAYLWFAASCCTVLKRNSGPPCSACTISIAFRWGAHRRTNFHRHSSELITDLGPNPRMSIWYQFLKYSQSATPQSNFCTRLSRRRKTFLMGSKNSCLIHVASITRVKRGRQHSTKQQHEKAKRMDGTQQQARTAASSHGCCPCTSAYDVGDNHSMRTTFSRARNYTAQSEVPNPSPNTPVHIPLPRWTRPCRSVCLPCGVSSSKDQNVKRKTIGATVFFFSKDTRHQNQKWLQKI